VSAGFTPDEDGGCSFCGREEAQSHTENCPAREFEGEYVEATERFNANVEAISKSIAPCVFCGQPENTHEPSGCCGDGGGSTFTLEGGEA
jgi:hypothetical protein